MKRILIALIVAFACIHPFNWHKHLKARGVAFATVVKFQWNASTGTVAGYKLYQGTVSGTYTSSVTIPGTGTNGEMDLDPAASRFVAATAYDASKRESAFSNEILCHPVIVSASQGGTISPSGTFFVQNGRTVTFTLAPAENYKLASVTVNGVPVSGETTRTVTVSARSQVVATFELIPPPSPPQNLELQVLQQIAADVSRIAKAIAPQP